MDTVQHTTMGKVCENVEQSVSGSLIKGILAVNFESSFLFGKIYSKSCIAVNCLCWYTTSNGTANSICHKQPLWSVPNPNVVIYTGLDTRCSF